MKVVLMVGKHSPYWIKEVDITGHIPQAGDMIGDFVVDHKEFSEHSYHSQPFLVLSKICGTFLYRYTEKELIDMGWNKLPA